MVKESNRAERVTQTNTDSIVNEQRATLQPALHSPQQVLKVTIVCLLYDIRKNKIL